MIELYQEAFHEIYTTEDLLENKFNPLSLFAPEIIDGPIIDIGCGHGSMLLDYAESERELFAIDVDNTALTKLEARVREISEAKIDNWKFLQLTFFKDQLPNREFSIINLSMLLHFFTIEECSALSEQLLPISKTGSLFCINVHSDKHKENSPENKNRFNYFKHYFSETDLNNLFPAEQFERLYFDNTLRRLSSKELDVMELYGRKMVLKGWEGRSVSETFIKAKSVEFREMQKNRELVATLSAIYIRK